MPEIQIHFSGWDWKHPVLERGDTNHSYIWISSFVKGKKCAADADAAAAVGIHWKHTKHLVYKYMVS